MCLTDQGGCCASFHCDLKGKYERRKGKEERRGRIREERKGREWSDRRERWRDRGGEERKGFNGGEESLHVPAHGMQKHGVKHGIRDFWTGVFHIDWDVMHGRL